MSDSLLTALTSNAVAATVLALAACLAQRVRSRPELAHALWLLVLVKLLLPPLHNLAVIDPRPSAVAPEPPAVEFPSTTATIPRDAAPLTEALDSDAPGIAIPLGNSWSAWEWALGFWGLGSACVLLWTLALVLKFHRQLKQSWASAPSELAQSVAGLSSTFNLASPPRVFITEAHLSPLLWWHRGRACIVLPQALLQAMDSEALRAVLAHELAHLRRRDHWVRWVEWATCVVFFWNPLVWWARRRLRALEEVCCDALVIRRLNVPPRGYASALLTAVEVLSTSPRSRPVLVSALHDGGSLEDRFRMILSHKTASRGLRLASHGVLLASLVLLPFGLTTAQEPDYEAVGSRLLRAVEKGELTSDQAKAMMAALAATRMEQRTDHLSPHGVRLTEDSHHVSPHAGGIVDMFGRIGIDPEQLGKIKHVLDQEGVHGPQMDLAFGVLLRAVHAHHAGHGAEDHHALSKALQEFGLKERQRAVVFKLAERLAHKSTQFVHRAHAEAFDRNAQRGQDHDHAKPTAPGGAGDWQHPFARELIAVGKVDGAWTQPIIAMLPRLLAAQKGIENPDRQLEIAQKMLGGMELTPDQVRLVLRLSHRLGAMAKRAPHAPHGALADDAPHDLLHPQREAETVPPLEPVQDPRQAAQKTMGWSPHVLTAVQDALRRMKVESKHHHRAYEHLYRLGQIVQAGAPKKLLTASLDAAQSAMSLSDEQTRVFFKLARDLVKLSTQEAAPTAENPSGGR